LEILDDEFYNKAEVIASDIAERANICCNRSDGYEEELKKFALDKIKDLIDIVMDRCY